LPWYRQRALLEGLEQEGIIRTGDAPAAVGSDGTATEVIDMTEMGAAEKMGLSVASLDEYRARQGGADG